MFNTSNKKFLLKRKPKPMNIYKYTQRDSHPEFIKLKLTTKSSSIRNYFTYNETQYKQCNCVQIYDIKFIKPKTQVDQFPKSNS